MEKGHVAIYYGSGRGKTTSAIGLGIRAVGNNQKVIMIQFLKQHIEGECRVLKDLEPYFKVFNFEKRHEGKGSLKEDEKEELVSEIKNAFKFAAKVMDIRECDLLILDEVLNTIEKGLIEEEELCSLIDHHKPEDITLVLTGHLLPEGLAERADYISFIQEIKRNG